MRCKNQILCVKKAAMIATGVWRAKKHKDAAPLAQRAWKRLKALRGERLWIQHACERHPRDRWALGGGSAGTRARRQAWDVHLCGGRRLEPLGAFGAEVPRASPGARPTSLLGPVGRPPGAGPPLLARGRQPGAAHGEVGGVRTSMRDIDGGGACIWVRRGCSAAPGDKKLALSQFY